MLPLVIALIRDFSQLPSERRLRLALFAVPTVALLTLTAIAPKTVDYGWAAIAEDFGSVDSYGGVYGALYDTYTAAVALLNDYSNPISRMEWSLVETLGFCVVLCQLAAGVFLGSPHSRCRLLSCTAAFEAARHQLRAFLSSLFRFIERTLWLTTLASPKRPEDELGEGPKLRLRDFAVFFKLGSATAS